MDEAYKNPKTLRELYHKKGLTQADISEKFGVDDSVISRLFTEYDIQVVYNRSRRKDGGRDAEVIRELYHDEGLTQKEIGERFGVSGTTIGRWMEDEGIDTKRLRKQDVIDEIQRLHNALGRVPHERDMKNHGKHSLNCGRREFGSWRLAVQEAGFEPNPHGALSGEDNPAWRGGYKKYYGPNWQKQRYKAVVRDQGRCQDCGMSENESMDWFGYKLDVHHLTPLKEFQECDKIEYEDANQIGNLLTLCRKCHQKRERSG